MIRMLFALVATMFVISSQSASAESSDHLFTGKTVRIVIGTSVGGEYGLYAQLIARHIGRFLPGTPTVIVQSMPGAAGVTALRYMANAAPRDGTVIIVPQVSIVLEGLLNPKAQFDPAKFQWIGRLTTQVQAGVVSTKSGVRSLADARTRELVAGGAGVTNPTTLNSATPTYSRAPNSDRHRLQRNGRCHDCLGAWRSRCSYQQLGSDHGPLRQRCVKVAVPIYVNAVKRPPELAHVPLMTDFGRNDTEKTFLKIYAIGAAIGRSLAAPPGVPQKTINVWRIALTKMLEDGNFKAAIQKSNIRIEPLDGASMAEAVADVVALPSDTVAKARKFYAELLADVR